MSSGSSWHILPSMLPVGRLVIGRVTHHAPFGVFVDINLPFVGLIQVTDFRDQGRMSPLEYPCIGAFVEAVVLGFAQGNRQIWLGVKPSQLSLGFRPAQLDMPGKPAPDEERSGGASG